MSLLLLLSLGDTTPGGTNDVLLKEDSGGILQEDGSSFLILE